jgi:hypothetical protein
MGKAVCYQEVIQAQSRDKQTALHFGRATLQLRSFCYHILVYRELTNSVEYYSMTKNQEFVCDNCHNGDSRSTRKALAGKRLSARGLGLVRRLLWWPWSILGA